MTDPTGTSPDNGWTALHQAAGSGLTRLVEDLLAAGSDPLGTAAGRTPYQVALAAGHRDTATVLRSAEDRAVPAGTVIDRSWRPYCKAYRLAELQQYAGWPGTAAVDEEDAIVYLHDDLTVTGTAWPGAELLFDGVDDGWPEFCRQTLHFAVPDDFDLLVPAEHAG